MVIPNPSAVASFQASLRPALASFREEPTALPVSNIAPHVYFLTLDIIIDT